MTSLLTAPALAILLPLTDVTPEAEDVTPGWIYPAVFFSLVAATVLLWFSMRSRLKKIRFTEDEPDSDHRDGTERDGDLPPDAEPRR